MGEFFRGWRRKAGLVTLAMACVLTVGLVRSYVVGDLIRFRISDQRHCMISGNANIAWYSYPVAYESYPEDSTRPFAFVMSSYGKSDSAFDGLMWAFSPENSLLRWIIPYWSLVLPLTLLSAWLILAKPRPPQSAKESSRG